jgi:molybdopterin molybdotransferase
MKTVQQAWEILMRLNIKTGPERVPIAQAAGRKAFEDVSAACDSPPFSLSRYDGYALGEKNTSDWFDIIIKTPLTAGNVFEKSLKSQQAIPIMTGAPLPEGTHYIVPHERCLISGTRLRPRLIDQNSRMSLRQGLNFRKGETYLLAGTTITPLHVAFLAMDGKSDVKVFSKPCLAVVSTGDELSVVIEKNLQKGHIRNSHPSLIYSALLRYGIVTQSEIVSDDPVLLKERFAYYINSDEDVIITTGGLGKGVRDFTRTVLKETGCFPLFEGIAAWPVGTFSAYETNGKIVFAFPGGLVSVLLLTKFFLEPFLKMIQGWQSPGNPGPFSAVELLDFSSDLPRFFPAKKGWIRFIKARCLRQENSDALYVSPLRSDDLSNLNAFIVSEDGASLTGKVKVFRLW